MFVCEMLIWLHVVASAGYMLAADTGADDEFREIVEVLNVFDLTRQLVCSVQLRVSTSFRCVNALEACGCACSLNL